MKLLAGAIVMLAGSLLWGMAVLATSWIYATQGNRSEANMATVGAIVIVIVGLGIIVSAYRE
jgi:hypothetical protein